MIIIGSFAMMLRDYSLLERDLKDYDLVGTEQECQEWVDGLRSQFDTVERIGRKWICKGNRIVELEVSAPGTSTDLLIKIVDEDPDTVPSPWGKVPSLDLLFTLKRSHRFVKDSPHFWKTLLDYHAMKRAGAKVRPEYQEFLSLRESEQYQTHHPRLNQSKQDFFADDQIQYVWDHDTIHESVAIFDKPAYLYYKRDGAEVQVSRKKFEAAPLEIRLAGVIEEAAVLAIERSLVPHPGMKTPHQAWGFALSKVLSSITSGWFREFGYEYAPEILRLYPEGYWEKFQRDINSGLVKPFKGKER